MVVQSSSSSGDSSPADIVRPHASKAASPAFANAPRTSKSSMLTDEAQRETEFELELLRLARLRAQPKPSASPGQTDLERAKQAGVRGPPSTDPDSAAEEESHLQSGFAADVLPTQEDEDLSAFQWTAFLVVNPTDSDDEKQNDEDHACRLFMMDDALSDGSSVGDFRSDSRHLSSMSTTISSVANRTKKLSKLLSFLPRPHSESELAYKATKTVRAFRFLVKGELQEVSIVHRGIKAAPGLAHHGGVWEVKVNREKVASHTHDIDTIYAREQHVMDFSVKVAGEEPLGGLAQMVWLFAKARWSYWLYINGVQVPACYRAAKGRIVERRPPEVFNVSKERKASRGAARAAKLREARQAMRKLTG
mmetsp:Transcript_54138/g.128908  ORF Transcript_54138/g.128908 Transcript_54138/m.128908 type:complete len:364 (+) Transcript_54138:67-1158(+)